MLHVRPAGRATGPSLSCGHPATRGIPPGRRRTTLSILPRLVDSGPGCWPDDGQRAFRTLRDPRWICMPGTIGHGRHHPGRWFDTKMVPVPDDPAHPRPHQRGGGGRRGRACGAARCRWPCAADGGSCGLPPASHLLGGAGGRAEWRTLARRRLGRGCHFPGRPPARRRGSGLVAGRGAPSAERAPPVPCPCDGDLDAIVGKPRSLGRGGDRPCPIFEAWQAS